MNTIWIEIDTGFVGCTYMHDTGISKEEWKSLSDKEQEEFYQEAIYEDISVLAKVCDEFGEDTGEAVDYV